MILEDRLSRRLSHGYYYDRLDRNSYFLKELYLNDNSTQFIVDNCILSNSVDVLKEVKSHLINGRGFLKDVCGLMKCVYGQLKYINELAKDNRLKTNFGVLKEFEKSYGVFVGEFEEVQRLTERSSYDDDLFHKYQLRVLDEMIFLRDILPYCVNNSNGLSLSKMFSEFTKRDNRFYVEKVSLRNGSSKNISKTDISLYLLGIYENNFSEKFRENTVIATNDIDFLVQGPYINNGDVLTSPRIFSSQIRKEFSKELQFSFSVYQQPSLEKEDLRRIVA